MKRTVGRVGLLAGGALALAACSEKPQDFYQVRSSSRAEVMPTISSQRMYHASTATLTSSPVAYHEPPTFSYEDRPLTENMAGSLEIADYVQGLRLAGLFPTLGNSGPYTVFAIPNGPFERFAASWSGGLMEPANRTNLRNVLGYTIVPGNWDRAALHKAIERARAQGQPAAVSLRTLLGATLIVRPDPQTGELVLANTEGRQTRLWLTGAKQSNGVLYFTQDFLPPGREPAPSTRP